MQKNRLSLRLRGYGRLFLALLLLLSLGTIAFGQEHDEDRVEFEKNIRIGPDETAGDISCFRCSVYVRGNVKGDILVFAGRVVLEGTVGGDIATFGGNIRLQPGSKVGGDVAAFGGRVRRDPTAVVGGQVNSIAAQWIVLPLAGFVAMFCVFIGFIVWLVARRRHPAAMAGTPGPRTGAA
jgi:cytoskeletal protein CcmA (bactofilin family)